MVFLQNFSTLQLAVFGVQGWKNHKKIYIWHTASTKNYHKFCSIQATKLIWACIELVTDTISALEQRSCTEPQGILNLYKIKDKLVKERSKCMKQASLCDMFKTVSQKNLQKTSSTEIYEPSVPATDDAVSTSSSGYWHCKWDIWIGTCAIN
jgi:hypothetical protein